MKFHTHPIEVSEKSGIRYLHFGSSWVQGAMRVRQPNQLELAYTREMMACLLLRQETGWPRKALLIGLGAASLTKFFYHQLPDCESTVVEINPTVVAVARQSFHLPPSTPGRLQIEIGDGADFIKESQESYDVILVDGFDPDARAGTLDTSSFYAQCRERLSSRGLLVTNLLGRNKGFAASAERLAEAFPERTLVFPSCDSGNTVAFAACGEEIAWSPEELKQRAEEINERTSLNLLPTLARVIEAGSLSQGMLRL
jgi:spermidine synthase